MYGIQPIHIVIIVIVAFLIFGASRLPEIGHSLGKSISEFRKGTKEAAEGFKSEVSKPSDSPIAPTQVSPSAPIQPTTPIGNFCIQCGNPNPTEAHFCASCGAKLPEKAS